MSLTLYITNSHGAYFADLDGEWFSFPAIANGWQQRSPIPAPAPCYVGTRYKRFRPLMLPFLGIPQDLCDTLPSSSH